MPLAETRSEEGEPLRVAFYAPIKPPDHPIPSGDRLIARNLIRALEVSGADVRLASRFISYSKRPDGSILQERKAAAVVEARQVAARLAVVKPDVFLTYHPYCKAPDWIGPHVAARLSIPYVTVEAARTGQGFENGQDLWRAWRGEAQVGLLNAHHHIAFKCADRDYLTGLGIPSSAVSMVPPFIDMASLVPGALPSAIAGELDDDALKTHQEHGPLLAAVGMMRPGKKLINFQLLAEALAPLQALPWSLVLVGDGPARGEVERAFQGFDRGRIIFCGALEHASVLAVMERADCLVWPGWKEPIGMVYLEAQAMGTPICALNSMGVTLSVADGETGLLAAGESAGAFRDVLSKMLTDEALRRRLAARSRAHIEENHSLSSASLQLATILRNHGLRQANP
ncbi:MAG: glycosyltransferase family 4 protein [Pseudomonadota bacterium]